MKFLKRQLAPLTDLAWRELERHARQVLSTNLSARKIVDFDGPHGFDFSALNLGELSRIHDSDGHQVNFGIRRLLPLVEARVPFELDIWNLDNLERGADQIDLGELTRSALALADFEERAVYQGLQAGGIQGVAQRSELEPLNLGHDPSKFPEVIAQGMLRLHDHGVGGPFALVLGSRAFKQLLGYVHQYPPKRQVMAITEGPIVHSRVLEGGLLMSLRGGDFRLTVGQDASLGYESHGSQHVKLFFTQSFTFQVISGEAALCLRHS